MTEPTVQVPVSRLYDIATTVGEESRILIVDALLSQPTQIAEPAGEGEVRRLVALGATKDEARRIVAERKKQAAEPGRIECPRCKGYGVDPSVQRAGDRVIDCARCGGDGEVTEPMGALDAKIEALGLRDPDEPARPDSLPFPHAKADRLLAEPPSIEDMAPIATHSSGKHRRVRLSEGDDLPVCDTCTNVLGLNVRWDHAVLRPGHDPSTIRDVTPPAGS